MSFSYAPTLASPITFKCNFHCQRCFAQTKTAAQCSRTTCKYLPYCHTHLKSICGLKVAPSTIPNAGDGLYATRDFAVGEVITVYYGQKLTVQQKNQRYGMGAVGLSTYGFTGNKRNPHSVVDGACYRSASVFANDVSISTNVAARAHVAAQYNAEIMDRNINMGGATDVPSLPFLTGSYACIVAIRPIQTDDEIFVDYGAGYWTSYPSVVSLTKPSKIKNPTAALPNPIFTPNNNFYNNPVLATPAVVPSPHPPANSIWHYPPPPGPAYVVPVAPLPPPPPPPPPPARIQPGRSSKSRKNGGFAKNRNFSRKLR